MMDLQCCESDAILTSIHQNVVMVDVSLTDFLLKLELASSRRLFCRRKAMTIFVGNASGKSHSQNLEKIIQCKSINKGSERCASVHIRRQLSE